MTALELDPRFTFDTFVVGSANRLAAAAARRVADAPGAAYNPLFLYSGSGLGKTHIVMAIGQHARRVHPDLVVVYATLEQLIEEITAAIQAGERDAFRHRLRDAGLLLLDDVQFLAGRRGAQEELLRAWDALASRGGQVVLASDRPPAEIDAIDDRLLSRFSGGLITDLAVPDYETRLAIVKRKTEERGQTLGSGVAEALARVGYGNVRELQGGLNRVLAVQELEAREVSADEVAQLLGAPPGKSAGEDEFGSFLQEITGVVAAAVREPTPEQRLADAVLRWEGDGYRTERLKRALAAGAGPADAETAIAMFQADVARLTEIATAIREVDNAARELERLDVLRDPDRVADAEALLARVAERMQELPAPPVSPNFAELELAPELLAVRAARAIAAAPGGAYNPFFVHGGSAAERTALLAALGNALRARDADVAVAFLDGRTFSAELVASLERNLADGWRERMRRAQCLIVDGIDALVDTERAQEELFHLFDQLRGSGAQLVFSAATPPRELTGLEARLRSRLESGLVVDCTVAGDAGAVPVHVGAAADAVTVNVTAPPLAVVATADRWFDSAEKVVWRWPDPKVWVVEELD